MDQSHTSQARYRLFGLTLASAYSFANRLALSGNGAQTAASSPPDLTLICTDQPPLTAGWDQVAPAYSSPDRPQDGECRAHLYRLGACDVVRLTGIADFHLWPERIVCQLWDPCYKCLAEMHLLGPVFSLWFELQGIPVLHASAVLVEGQAVAFVSSNFGGKTSLAATLMQAGHPLVTDDVLPVEHDSEGFRCRPGYPTMRMWPEEAERFLGSYEHLELVHPALTKRRVPVGIKEFGTFCDAVRPLACIYLPERRKGMEHTETIDITPVSPRDALIEMVRHSFTPQVVEAIGLQPQRMALYAQMVQQVPVRRLEYPNGFAHLPRVRQAVLEDLKSLRPKP